MRSFFSFITSSLFLVAAFLYLGYVVYHYHVPCITPVSYALSIYDERFALSETEVEAQIDVAAKVWNDVLGRKIFVEDREVTLPVIFEYGELQQTLNTLGELQEDIDATKQELTEVANKYATLKKQFDELNKRGRATQAMVDELNALAKQYNDLRKNINADVAAGRNVPQEETEAGLYISDRNGTRVYVYGFDSKKELISILIHEFGHALGLGHVADVRSVMYPTDKSESTELNKADLAELTRACTESTNSPAGKVYTLVEPLFPYLEPIFTYAETFINKLGDRESNPN